MLELLIVIMVIAILAAISIPLLTQGRFSAYESTAHTYLRNIHQAEVSFHTRDSKWGTIAELQAGNFLTSQDLRSYTVIVTIFPDGSGYEATATPVVQPTELRHFFVDTTGVVRYAVGVPADQTSPPL